jgi:UDP-2,4-diacetamido-2,4,6-trideoxy-beta-L-altropyranose hydrolase
VKVCFRVDASRLFGIGHVMRCLTLADAVRAAGAETLFVSAALPAWLEEKLLAAGHEVRRIPASSELDRDGPGWEAASLSEAAQAADAAGTGRAVGAEADWLVVDHYLLDRSWETAARAFAGRLLVIDDLANRGHDCDLVVDQTLGRTRSDYDGLTPASARLLLGPVHALLRPEFPRERPAALARRRVPQPVRSILVSLGATDVGGLTMGAVRAALRAVPEASVEVVTGSGAPSLPELRALAKDQLRVRLHVDTAEMAALMRDADLAVGASGSTSWERCCLGLPTVAVVLAENQRMVAAKLDEAGAAAIAEDVDAVADLLVALSREEGRRLSMTAAAAALADGSGVERVVRAMTAAAPDAGAGRDLTLRRATAEDSEMVWLWRNDPATREVSRSTAPVAWPDHARWYERTLAGADRQLFMAEEAARPVGLVRFDALERPDTYEVSINIAPDARAGGIGKAVLSAGCSHWLELQGPVRLEAAIRDRNEASRRIFQSLGFVADPQAGPSGFRRYVRPHDAGAIAR